MAHEEWARANSHSELITQALETVLSRTKTKVADIDSLAVGIGPGSFTGIRVGLNLVRALSFVYGHPILPVHSLQVLAHQAFSLDAAVVTCAVNAFRNRLYLSQYQQTQGEWVETIVPQVVKRSSS